MSEHQTNMVVVGFIVKDDKIFIAKRAPTKETFPDRYELVGGHIDPGEQPEQALLREVQEELGIEVTIGRPVGSFTYYSEDQFKIEIAYLCYTTNTDEPTLNPADHSESRWISRDEIDKFEKDDEETALLRKAFELMGDK